MALKITLKPYEKIMIGEAVIANGSSRADLLIENNVPILREKDIMTEEQANSPCKKIYFVVQLMYINENNIVQHHNVYWKLVKDIVEAAPSTLPLIDQISSNILAGKYYQAMKLSKKLIEYEQEAMKRVRKST